MMIMMMVEQQQVVGREPNPSLVFATIVERIVVGSWTLLSSLLR